jgi:hypothetical protein
MHHAATTFQTGSKQKLAAVRMLYDFLVVRAPPGNRTEVEAYNFHVYSPGAKVKAKHLVRATVFSSNRAICPFIAKHREVEWMIPTLLDNHAISLGESTV